MTRRGNTKTRIRDRERAIGAAVAERLIGPKEWRVGARVRSISSLDQVGTLVHENHHGWWVVSWDWGYTSESPQSTMILI